jgi:putative DNA primase/helicase
MNNLEEKPKFTLELMQAHLDELTKEVMPEMANHTEITSLLLAQIKKVDFREVISLPEGEDLKQKHIIYAITKNLLRVSEDNKWNLARAYDYIYVFNGAFWRQFDKEQIKNFLGESAIKMGCPDYEAKQWEFKDKLLKQFLSDAFLDIPEPSEEEVLINFQNGTGKIIDSRFVLNDFEPSDFITYQLPYQYDNTATCTMFDKYLSRVLPDEASRMLLQEFCGFIFTRLNIEKCLMLIGGGKNGKSVFFNILNALVGKENVLNFSLGLFGHEYNRAKLTNVLLNYSSEKGFDLPVDTFKALISGEPVQAREPYGKPFTLKNRAKFIFNTNSLPKETEASEAYFRRFLVIPFEQVISDSEVDIDLADKIIKSELAGVFNWVLEGLNRIMKNRKFSECEKSKNAIEEFKKSSDSVLLFIEDENYGKSVAQNKAIKELFNEYKLYCIDSNFRACGIQNFASRLTNAGFETEKKNYGKVIFIEKIYAQ